MVITKNSTVHFKRFTPAMMSMLNVLYALNQQQIPDFPEDFVITSANDSTSHSVKSKHYEDKAIDVRSKNFKTRTAKFLFINRVQHILGPKFTALLENHGTANEHFHIQVKRGENFP
jgi:hypothetical protein